MLKHLLIFRFLLINVVGFVGVGLAYQRGWLEYLFANDPTYITVAITSLFYFVWFTTLRRVVRTSRDLDAQKAGACYMKPGKQSKVWAKIAWLLESSETMIGLGLIGTVIGFSIALSGVNEDSLGNAAGVTTALGPLMVGMKIALNTTIVGSILGMWNGINQRMLRTAVSCYLADCEDGNRVHFQVNVDTAEDFRSGFREPVRPGD